jgi:hypothetical protein
VHDIVVDVRCPRAVGFTTDDIHYFINIAPVGAL